MTKAGAHGLPLFVFVLAPAEGSCLDNAARERDFRRGTTMPSADRLS